jgi:hypothetical protein
MYLPGWVCGVWCGEKRERESRERVRRSRREDRRKFRRSFLSLIVKYPQRASL